QRPVEVQAVDLMTGGSKWDSDSAAAHPQLQDGAAGPGRHGQVEIEVAGVLLEVHVVQPRECGRDARILAGHLPKRTGCPAAFLTASALIASRTARLAAIAVTSAWS